MKYLFSSLRSINHSLLSALLPTAREGYVFTGVCLSTIGIVATRSLLDLVTARSVRILLECCLVRFGDTLCNGNVRIEANVYSMNVA